MLFRSDVEALLLPPALVMTLAENAVKHGIEPAPNGGRIEVNAAINGGHLVITVVDTGMGLVATKRKETETETGSGMGLSNIAQRLQAIYGDAAHVRLAQNAPNGCIATLTLPLLSGKPIKVAAK